MNGVFKAFVSVFVSLIFCLCAVSPCLSTDTANTSATKESKDAEKAPAVFFPAPRFEFDRMIEGEEILHDFVIMNKGTGVLLVQKVKTSCGCTTVSYSKEIPPGGEGIISMKVNTRGYGGRKLSKTITVMTNDIMTPNVTLTVSGMIENFVTIIPRFLRLTGKAGETVKSVVKIVPESKYPFSITGISAQDRTNIKYELNENTADSGEKEYAITVENVKKEAGSYYDVLILKTDSKIQPEIKINVMTKLMDANLSANTSTNALMTGEKMVNESNGNNNVNNFLEIIQKMQKQNTTGINSDETSTHSAASVQDTE
ncbi:exported hypothetical protein [Desulfamplus magnetovallimortis]|uniref:DUF1573 domain-containing protein n=1 Tax=Desulfamplus magnetovallimortis TaxID=1246637 RepID=A0A1W1H7L8_9BACT|nr:DUF1573 domain-containing protein [Desulfamplus magnetovallimortis]SLM28459.1 exported hypothetical protein [Desulfamplus magnetovallimortis]